MSIDMNTYTLTAASSVCVSNIASGNLTIGTSTINDSSDGATIVSQSGNGLTITNQSYYSTDGSGYFGDSGNIWNPWNPAPQPYNQPPTIYPSYPAQPDIIIQPVEPKDELKSPPKDEKVKEGHVLTATMKIYGDAVVVEYYCSHCNQIIHREVISKVPRRIIEEKCLPRIVKEVK